MTAIPDALVCPFCGEMVNPNDRTAWHRMSGWERAAGKRASGKTGGSDIALRQAEEGLAHGSCIREAQAGLVHQQEISLSAD